MRFVPVARRARVDLQRRGERDGGVRRLDHHTLDDLDRLLGFPLRRLEDEFVMHLQQHLRREPF